MTKSLVFLTEPSSRRRDTIAAILRRIPATEVHVFDTIAATRKMLRTTVPHLMIGPWSQGGETLLAARAAVIGHAGCTTVPLALALVLAEAVTPMHISMTRDAGHAELIPCDPLDETGLFNRLTLLLHGSDALYASLDARHSLAFDTALQHMPALKRRLAA